MDSFEKAMRDALMDESSTNYIVLIGGSTRIIKTQKLFQDFCNDKGQNRFINPEGIPARLSPTCYAKILTQCSRVSNSTPLSP